MLDSFLLADFGNQTVGNLLRSQVVISGILIVLDSAHTIETKAASSEAAFDMQRQQSGDRLLPLH